MQARSKPVQPPTKPANAPFFLPTVAGVHGDALFDPTASQDQAEDQTDNPSTSSRINRSAGEHVRLLLALPCLALPCLALPCLALPCLALPCLALPLPCLCCINSDSMHDLSMLL